MKRGIDHLVLNVKDLDQARATYAKLGFTTTPRAEHPFGTGNSLVQLQGNFLELLAIIDESKISDPGQGQFSFGNFNGTFLERREGMSMLVFEGHDAPGDKAEFAGNGLQTYEVFDFERKATLPDGQSVTVGFSLAFVTVPSAPEMAFFTCQQHAPEYFWKPEYQSHENGAVAVAEVVMVAEDRAPLAHTVGKMQNAPVDETSGEALRVATARGDVTLLTPDLFSKRFQSAAPGGAIPHFAAYRISVSDTGHVAALLNRNEVAHRQLGNSVVVDANQAFGTVIEFAPHN